MTVKNFINSSGDLDYPTILPTLDLDFANSKTLDPRITFTRSSGGSYVGVDGLIKYAGVNQPRFDHDPITGESLGFSIEEQRTNLLTYNEDFSNVSWVKSRCTVSSNAKISPNGTLTASVLKATSVFDFHQIQRNPTLTTGTIYTLSIFVKPAGITSVFLLFGAGAMPSQQNATFNLLTGRITNISSGSSASIIKYPNGWWRVSLTSVPTTSTATSTANLYLGNNQFVGDKTSGVYIWGAQLEEGAFPTSYIPTKTSTRTRNSDNASMTGTNFSSWYNQSEGTLFTQAKSSATISILTRRFLEVGDGTSTNRYLLGFSSTSNTRFLVAQGNSTSISITVISTPSIGVKICASYTLNNFSTATNGILGAKDLSGSAPTVNNMILGWDGVASTTNLNGTISRLTYYPKRLPNSQLQALTR